MKVRAHPRYAELKRWLRTHAAHATPFRANCFRVAGPRYTTADDVVSGFGGWKGGGRWNPAGVMRTVYLSTDAVTALSEALAHHSYFGLPHADAMPKVTVAVGVTIAAILDLTVLPGAWPIAMADLIGEDWRAIAATRREAGPQAVGRAAFAIGLGGLIVPSHARAGGTNVVIFPERLTRSERLEVLQPGLLAKLGKPT